MASGDVHECGARTVEPEQECRRLDCHEWQCLLFKQEPNAQGKRHRSTEGAEGTNKGQDNGEALALVGVRLTAQLG